MPNNRPLSQERLEDAKRLREIFRRRQDEDRSVTQEWLALECGWKTQGAAQQYLNGKIPLNVRAVVKLATALKVEPTEISPELGAELRGISLAPVPEERAPDLRDVAELVSLYGQLPARTRLTVLNFIRDQIADLSSTDARPTAGGHKR
jgi:transcriptional regulator with XRE-family HTH domain